MAIQGLFFNTEECGEMPNRFNRGLLRSVPNFRLANAELG
jgi:hypothetical protein